MDSILDGYKYPRKEQTRQHGQNFQDIFGVTVQQQKNWGNGYRWTALSFPVVGLVDFIFQVTVATNLTVPGTSTCEMYLYTVVPC